MSCFYDKETDRLKMARKVLDEYGLSFKVSDIGAYETDGDIRVSDFPITILKGELEIGSGSGTEPLFQAAWYYVEAVRLRIAMKTHKLSKFPCLIMYLAGTCVRILIGRPHINA